MILIDNKKYKMLKSENMNFFFDKTTGYTEIWGKTKDEDVQFSPYGPMIADIELSTICHDAKCPECYKNNVSIGKSMSLEEFKVLFSKFPSVLTQIAFGIGSIDSCPDLFEIMQYCREKGVIPNITINGFGTTDEIVKKLVSVVGAVAVSNHSKKTCYDSVKKLCDAGLKQVNIHQVLSEETKHVAYDLIEDVQNDDRLKGLNAVVFLSLKQRGRGAAHHKISEQDFQNIINLCFEKNISFGMDSCTAHKFLDAIKGHPEFERISQSVEPCESGILSSYINKDGKFYPCSFSEDGEGIDVLNCENFLDDVWYNPKTVNFRNNLIVNKRNCPLYDI